MQLKNVLLIDDDEGFNFLSRITFSDNNINCAVHEAVNGKEALDYLGSSEICPEIILLDINMPVMDGFEFLDNFKHMTRCSGSSKIFILTSSGREEDQAKSFNSELVRGYFNKPLTDIHVKQILSTVEQ